MIDDRRQDNRVLAYLPAKWEGMSGIHEARLEDISLSGCFVNSNGRVEINQSVTLDVEFQKGQWVRLQGEVSNYQPGIGFGLAFQSPISEEAGFIRDLLE